MILRRTIISLSALAAGATGMVLELSSVRALAPYFGASTEVWTGAIGVVLFALAAGYALGGAIAERGRPALSLGVSFVLSGAAAAAAPFVLPRFVKLIIPEPLYLEDAAFILRSGAFITQCAIFGAPVLLLGFVNPLLVRAHPAAGAAPARVAGWILAMSTLGGLAGTFGTTYLLIPQFGVRTTLLGSGLLLGSIGTAILAGDRRTHSHATLGLVLLPLAGWFGFVASGGPAKPERAGEKLLAERESRYQYLRVVEPAVENPEANPAREIWLQVNECLDSFQSVDAPNRATPGHYYDILAAAALLCGAGREIDVCVIGAGGGAVVRALLDMTPARVDAVEIDAEIVTLGRERMRLSDLDARTRWITGTDGRFGLAHSRPPEREVTNSRGESGGGRESGYDAILIDAYARQVEIPFHLVTKEMFELCKEKLRRGGIVAINVSSFGDADPVLRAVAATAESAFSGGGSVGVFRVRGDHNAVVVARRGAPVDGARRLLARARTQLSASAAAAAQFIASPAGAYSFTRASGDVILTDDLAPMERLQAQSLRLAGAGGGGGK